MLTPLGWAVVVASALAMGALTMCGVAARRAGKALRDDRTRATHRALADLDRRWSDIETLVIDRPMLMGLYDRNDDLVSSERMAGVKLDAFARLHLHAFASAARLPVDASNGGPRDAPVDVEPLAVWEGRMRDAFATSQRLRDIYLAGRASYGSALSRWYDAAFPEPAADSSGDGSGLGALSPGAAAPATSAHAERALGGGR